MKIKIENYPSMQVAMEQLCSFLQSQGVSEDSVFHCKLAASELVGNVLRHSNGYATLHTQLANGVVELVIQSSVQFTPPTQSVCADLYAEHGRGLFLVDAISIERTTTEAGDILVKIKM